MQDEEVKFWLVYTQGINVEGEQLYFALAYCGKTIVWEYLLELVEDEYELRKVQFNGYQEISEQEFQRISHEDSNF